MLAETNSDIEDYDSLWEYTKIFVEDYLFENLTNQDFYDIGVLFNDFEFKIKKD